MNDRVLPGVTDEPQYRKMVRWLAVGLLMLALPTLAAAGTRSYDSVTVSLEPPADISSQYGYAVYRLTVANRGNQARTVTVSLPAESWSYGDSIRRISRTVRVEPNSAAVAEILQPPLPMNGSDARVSIDGKPQEDLLPVALADHLDNFDGQPILVSRGVDGRVRTNFEAAMTEVRERGTSSAFSGAYGGYGGYGGYSDTLARMARAERPVSEWSGNWLAYSRYLAVMISEDELRSALAPVDAALRDYAAAGGIVVVVGPEGKTPVPSGPWAAAWMTPEPADAQAVTYRLGAGGVRYVSALTLGARTTDTWEDWVENRLRHTQNRRARLDASSAEGRLPMLETVRVPTRSLLFMMLLFTLLIGPVNIVALSLMKKRMWLLWTIPTIALFFASAVLGYSLISEGVRPRAKTVAVTLLDQHTRQAVTLGMTGYYAPLTPGDGLRYDDRTEVTPQSGDSGYYGYNDGGRARSMDVTNGQHLSSGWIIARVPAHFGLRQVETRRERLDISRADNGGLTVVNGLGVPIKRLIVADADGRAYRFEAVSAGDSASANPTELNATAHASLQEQLTQRGALEFANMARRDFDDFVFPGTYIAELDNASFLAPGLDNLVTHEVTGVVVGRWREAE